MRRRPAAATGERGTVLVLMAIIMTALVVIVALVIDMGMVRENRQSDKSAADFSAAAGIRSVDNGSGRVQPWRGICAARSYLQANHPELSGLIGTSYGNASTPPTTYATDPCDSTATAPYTGLCAANAPATWGRYVGTADGGRLRVTIQNGYQLPDPEFPEDDLAYDTDDGAALSGGCDHLAVIVEESEDAYFGGAAGVAGYNTRMRSVARLVEGTEGDVTAALILLERNDCDVLDVMGETAWVRIQGNLTAPGVIHSDSLGNGACTGKIFDVNGSTPPPRIVVENAASTDPVSGSILPGQISTAALSGLAGANPGAVSDGIHEVCAQVDEADCGSTTPVTGDSPIGRKVVGRSRVDERYRLPIIALRDEAERRFAWSPTNSPNDDPLESSTWATPACTDPGPFTASHIWIDCAGGDFIGNDKVFESTVQEVVIDGWIKFTGSSKTLHFKSPTQLFIEGHSSGAVVLGSSNNLLVNDGGMSDGGDTGDFVCDDRFAAAQGSTTRMVLGKGDIQGNGGELRLCNTTLFMMDDDGTCAVPATDGVAPYDNSCDGAVRVAGTSRTDWTAPNVRNDPAVRPVDADFANFEDLAFWSETAYGPGTGWSIRGSGGVQLSGIFFTPNADPFSIGGSGTYDIEEAQFITRRLEVAGGGNLTMSPDPHNSIQIPVLGGFTLVR